MLYFTVFSLIMASRLVLVDALMRTSYIVQAIIRWLQPGQFPETCCFPRMPFREVLVMIEVKLFFSVWGLLMTSLVFHHQSCLSLVTKSSEIHKHKPKHMMKFTKQLQYVTTSVSTYLSWFHARDMMIFSLHFSFSIEDMGTVCRPINRNSLIHIH